VIVKNRNRKLLAATLLSGIVVGGMGYVTADQQQQIRILHEENMKIKKDLENAVEKVETTTKELQKTKTIVSQVQEDNGILRNENAALIEALKKQKAEALKTQSMPSRGSINFNRDWMDFISTAYISFCKEGCSGKTRTGFNVSSNIFYNGMRIIAVDTNVIPLHSVVELNVDGKIEKAIALDTGGGIRGHHIDYLISARDTNQAIQYGKKNIKLRILRWGEDGY
jgi:3D (Asp-Asp-Asp) domain-containing protein